MQKPKTKPHLLWPGGSTHRSGGLCKEGSRCWMLRCLLGELEWPQEEEGDSKREVWKGSFATQCGCSFPAPAQPQARRTHCAQLRTPQVHRSVHSSTPKANPKQLPTDSYNTQTRWFHKNLQSNFGSKTVLWFSFQSILESKLTLCGSCCTS